MRTIIIFCILCLGVVAAEAKSYTPQLDDEILEVLPYSSSEIKLKKLRKALDKDPKNLDLAFLLANNYHKLAKETNDPRYYSYAESAIKAWWTETELPAAVIYIRASIKQFRHEFNDALKDLDLVLEEDPVNSSSLLMKASILRLQAKYDEARNACLSLDSHEKLIKEACLASIDSLNGSAEDSYKKLQALNKKMNEKDTSKKTWVLTVLGDIAAQLNKFSEAETYYKSILENDSSNGYILAAYSDLLLANDKADQVIELLKDLKPMSDNLLLRYVLAKKEEGSKDFNRLKEKLANSYKLSTDLANNVHQREEAIFNLKVLGNAKKALELAEINWQSQKEPIDLKILQEAQQGDHK